LRVYEAASKVATLNALVTEAKGDWVAVLDVDDTWDRSKLLVQAAASIKDASGAAVIGTFCNYFGAVESGGPDLPPGWIPREILPSLNPLINSSALIRRPLAHWSEQFPGLDDYDLWYRLAGGGVRFYNVPLRLVHHRIHPSSAFNASGVQDVVGLRAWHAAAGTLTRGTESVEAE
jgi:glycosyltransferase involved in cell wall biosynthesis